MDENDTLVVEGWDGVRKLKGTIAVMGSKNDALQALASSLLFRSPLKLTNVPEIEDIGKMSVLLANLGVVVTKNDKTLTLDSSGLKDSRLDSEIAKQMRASIILTGPLLARQGEAHFPHPGG